MEYNQEPSEEDKDKWIKDPKNWIWGIFYYNPKDKRIFPPKRTKQLGLTINFANPNSVLLFTILIVILLMLSKYIK
ncbi:DUF5808 domain-containing protein [Flavobacterium sp. HTF]|uniref:DUF5808 domain-containing protein n=1 Tax=Flavobacterium sp. HTF TaxID=2170732 RepID=UPI000D5CFD3A|nr:DUF5808 domain-containing protein [Flavobacterium sp. HTF]PWB20749.1 hypothetical protein DCO46_20190 [Flavobacterium sp. HTF]